MKKTLHPRYLPNRTTALTAEFIPLNIIKVKGRSMDEDVSDEPESPLHW